MNNYFIIIVFGVLFGLVLCQKPNIIVFVSDDQGYGDIPYNGDQNLLTPNIDTLAADGVILNNFHVQALCSPSRGAFLSGNYPIHSGQQHMAADGVILNNFHTQSLCSPSRGVFLSGYYPIHSGPQHMVIQGLLKNSIILFYSDNGAVFGGGSNYPLRGGKATNWQGSFRVPAFVWSPLIKKKGYVSNELIHVTDLLPTLMEAIGENPLRLGNIDGKSQWDTFVSNAPSSRNELLYNVDAVYNICAIRVGKWKLKQGEAFPEWSGWFKPPQIPSKSE